MLPSPTVHGSFQIKSGLLGTPSQKQARAFINEVLLSALPPDSEHRNQAGEEDHGKGAIAYHLERMLRDASLVSRPGERQSRSRDYALIPLRWFTTITRERGRAPYRTHRAYHEAIHLLGYILFKYSSPYRIPGEMLILKKSDLCKAFGISEYAFREALRYLGREGYVYRVACRGFVPWRPKKLGTYLFVVPRLERLQEASTGAVVSATPKGSVIE